MSTVHATIATVAPRGGRHLAPKERRSITRGARTVPDLVGSLISLHRTAREVAAIEPTKDRGRTDPRQAGGTAHRSGGSSAASPAPAEAPRDSEGTLRYRVVEGDTVSDIAARFGLSTASVLARNGLGWKSVISAGQTLVLTPSGRSREAEVSHELVRYTVQAGDSITSIAATFGVSTASVLLANGLGRQSTVRPGESLVIPVVPTSDGHVHTLTVRTGEILGLTDEMLLHARIVVDVGRGLGADMGGLVVALSAAMQESSLRNLDYGDADAVGLFQMRPSRGWGTREQLLDPAYAAAAFFGGPGSPSRGTTGLLDVDGWRGMSVTQAAHAVQRTANPLAYAKWEASARAWVSDLV